MFRSRTLYGSWVTTFLVTKLNFFGLTRIRLCQNHAARSEGERFRAEFLMVRFFGGAIRIDRQAVVGASRFAQFGRHFQAQLVAGLLRTIRGHVSFFVTS